MLEKPDLPDETLIAALRDHFDIAAAALKFLPLGADANAWAYRADAADGQRWFVKLRRGELHVLGLAVPRYLYDQGIEQVVAPLRTRSGERWATVGDYALIVSPFIDGQRAADAVMTQDHWREFGRVLRRIHSTTLPPDLAAQMPRQAWPAPLRLSFVETLRERIANGFRNESEAELAAFWQANESRCFDIEQRLARLYQQIQADPSALTAEYVLCHADLHRFNMMIGDDGRLWIVDWDETLLAPRERDLMFLNSGIDGPGPDAQERACFDEGYGPAAVNPLLIAYYRFDWLMQDLNAFAEWVLIHDDLGAETKAHAIQLIKRPVRAGRRGGCRLPGRFRAGVPFNREFLTGSREFPPSAVKPSYSEGTSQSTTQTPVLDISRRLSGWLAIRLSPSTTKTWPTPNSMKTAAGRPAAPRLAFGPWAWPWTRISRRRSTSAPMAGASSKPTDYGATWTPVGLDGQIVRSLAISALQPGTIYAGTKPAHLYVSHDYGASWAELPAFRRMKRWWWFTPADKNIAAYVMDIVLSPTDPNLMIAGIELGGVLRSGDGGATWEGHMQGAVLDCHDLAFHPTDGNWVYEGSGGGASFSRDAGKTWSQPDSMSFMGKVWMSIRGVRMRPDWPRANWTVFMAGPSLRILPSRISGITPPRPGR